MILFDSNVGYPNTFDKSIKKSNEIFESSQNSTAIIDIMKKENLIDGVQLNISKFDENFTLCDFKCFGCQHYITNTETVFQLKRINSETFAERLHIKCFICSKCGLSLTEVDEKCWIKNNNIICCDCKKKMTHCQRCNTLVSSDAWVHRLNDFPFHISCFTCYVCSRQLTKGEKCGLIEDRLFCHDHFLEICNGKSETESEGNNKNKMKRIRTSFTPEQLAILQANFDSECNPDGQELEKIANTAQLNKRVTQVWFQNARARKKKTTTGTSGVLSSSHSSVSCNQINVADGKNGVLNNQGANSVIMRYSSSIGSDSNSHIIENFGDTDDKFSSDSGSCTSTPLSTVKCSQDNQLSFFNSSINNNMNSNNNNFINKTDIKDKRQLLNSSIYSSKLKAASINNSNININNNNLELNFTMVNNTDSVSSNYNWNTDFSSVYFSR